MNGITIPDPDPDCHCTITKSEATEGMVELVFRNHLGGPASAWLDLTCPVHGKMIAHLTMTLDVSLASPA